jgi:hypothetical protein
VTDTRTFDPPLLGCITQGVDKIAASEESDITINDNVVTQGIVLATILAGFAFAIAAQ